MCVNESVGVRVGVDMVELRSATWPRGWPSESAGCVPVVRAPTHRSSRNRSLPRRLQSWSRRCRGSTSRTHAADSCSLWLWQPPKRRSWRAGAASHRPTGVGPCDGVVAKVLPAVWLAAACCGDCCRCSHPFAGYVPQRSSGLLAALSLHGDAATLMLRPLSSCPAPGWTRRRSCCTWRCMCRTRPTWCQKSGWCWARRWGGGISSSGLGRDVHVARSLHVIRAA